MAVAPLFIADLSTLLARLRLTGMNSSDAAAQVDQAVEDVRLGLYRELGKTLVDTLLAIAYVENATTTEALRRTQANAVELAWVRLLLMQRMPMLFMDAGGVTMEAWNEEHVARRTPSKAELQRLEAEVEAGLALLREDADAGDDLDIITFEPESDPDVPHQTIFPIIRT